MKSEFELHEHQRAFTDSNARLRALISGIGGGKTYIGCLESLKMVVNFPNTTGAIIAPTYRMLSDTTRRTFFELCPRELIVDFKKSDNELILANGSSILFRSADEPEKLRGPNLGWFYIDEAAILRNNTAWKIMVGRIRKPPERGWITTTPKGFDWIYDEFIENKTSDHWSISFASSDNLFLSHKYIESIKRNYSGSFLRQEFYGEFVGFEGLVYPEFKAQQHVFNGSLDPDKVKRIVVGIDWGYTNPSVALFIAVDKDDNMAVMEEIYIRRQDIENFIALIKQVDERYYNRYKMHCSTFYCDPSEPMFIEKFMKSGLRAVKADNEIMAGINAVASRLSNNTLTFNENCMNTITEARQYRYPDTPDGKTEKEQPLKINDHCMDALRYAVFNMTNSSKPAFLMR